VLHCIGQQARKSNLRLAIASAVVELSEAEAQQQLTFMLTATAHLRPLEFPAALPIADARIAAATRKTMSSDRKDLKHDPKRVVIRGEFSRRNRSASHEATRHRPPIGV
jgi:hypothetical protein